VNGAIIEVDAGYQIFVDDASRGGGTIGKAQAAGGQSCRDQSLQQARALRSFATAIDAFQNDEGAAAWAHIDTVDVVVAFAGGSNQHCRIQV